jgi:hypothetical protein
MRDLIQFKLVDGYQIVTGFRKRKIDRRATRRETLAILAGSDKPQYLIDAEKEVEVALTVNGEPRNRILDYAHFRMGEAVKQYKEDIEALQNENVKYIEIMPNEIYNADTTELQNQFKTLGNKQLLTVDGTIVKDCRGREYWRKVDDVWECTKIDAIGVDKPSGSKLYKNLTAEEHAEIAAQLETERIAALSAEEKTNEKNRMITAAGHKAVGMRSLAEIGGTDAATALSDAQAWLATETAAIEAKYA